MTKIAVVDCGMGNLRSVHRALEHVAPEARVVVTHRAEDIRHSDCVVLPGQGSMRAWIDTLDEHALREVIDTAVRTRPVLGICLGLQVLYEFSEEGGGTNGLGLCAGTVRHFETLIPAIPRPLKIPHMGWNNVRQVKPHFIWNEIPESARFYFVHSYFVASESGHETVGETEYGDVFTSAAAFGNVFAVQFHPEKSQRSGLRLLSNFVRWNGQS